MENEYTLEQSRTSNVDFPSIIAGTILALAISIILFNFGGAIGLSVEREYNWDGENPWAGVVTVGLWIIWIKILASLTGGYLTGRMRRPVAGATPHEREIRDGAHGLLVWALGTVLITIAASIAFFLAEVIKDSSPILATQTQEILDRQHNATIIFAFITAASSFVSAVASWWAATRGGEHRDMGTDHSRYIAFQKR